MGVLTVGLVEIVAACERADVADRLASLAGPRAPRGVDRRIRTLMEEMRAEPARPFRAPATAARLGLSTSHFLRLFAAHTGTTFRRYQQWGRLLHVVRGLDAGHDLTRCAADAGFASPSHLSDTFRRTLGTTATAVLGARVRFDLLECA